MLRFLSFVSLCCLLSLSYLAMVSASDEAPSAKLLVAKNCKEKFVVQGRNLSVSLEVFNVGLG